MPLYKILKFRSLGVVSRYLGKKIQKREMPFAKKEYSEVRLGFQSVP